MVRGSVYALLLLAGCAGIAGLDEFVDETASGAAVGGGSAAGGAGGGAPCEGEGTPCIGGLCHEGICDASSCFIEGTWYQSADGPGDCRICDPAQSQLDWSTAERGEPCTDGLCYAGGCCTGCWDGNTCHVPTVTLCGIAGSACMDCTCGGTCTGNCTNDPACNANATQTYWIPAACNAGVCGYGTPECCAPMLDCFPTGCGT